ncbi:MAG: MFS transporter [Bacillota bacterium]|jgi:MFS family permease
MILNVLEKSTDKSSFEKLPFDKLLDQKLKGKKFPISLMAALIVIGLLISYSHNSSPAPFMASIFEYFAMNPTTDQALANLSMSLFLLITIPATFIGTGLEQKIGTRNLFTIAMLLNTAGILIVFLSPAGYGMYLVGRAIYGFGFGLAIPALGSAIMRWYRPKSRRIMTTLNGMFPLFGALISFTLFPAIAQSADNWIFGHGFSGFITLAVLIIWLVAVRKDVDNIDIATEEEKYLGIVQTEEKINVVKWALGTNQVRCILIAFICDFTMYMYIATVLPLWLMTAGGMDELTAGTWAAIAFPAFGVIGVILGGIIINVTGKRKPVIVVCQFLKLIGVLIACLGADVSVSAIIFGIALFGLGNGGWMPPMFLVPTEIPGTSASKVAASYSVFMSAGFAAGFIMPVVGGLIATSLIAGVVANGVTDEVVQLAYGYKWSVLILGFSHILAIIAAFALKETGPGKRKKELADEASAA